MWFVVVFKRIGGGIFWSGPSGEEIKSRGRDDGGFSREGERCGFEFSNLVTVASFHLGPLIWKGGSSLHFFFLSFFFLLFPFLVSPDIFKINSSFRKTEIKN